MSRLLCCLLLVFGLGVATPGILQAQTRAYAPENLRTLPYRDQVRVISLEYSEQSRGRRIPDDQLRFYTDQVSRSNWTFSRIKQDIAQSLAGNGYQPQPPVGGNSIRCESDNNRPRTCTTPWRGRSRLVRQLSGSACIEGRSWQSQQGQVYVSGGCRAEFAPAVQVLPPVAGDTIRCQSENNRAQTCRTSWPGRSRLVRTLSGAPCIEGRSWRSQQGQVVVEQGCRAEFARGIGGGPGPGQGSGYTVTCESYKGGSNICAWDQGQGLPRLVEQLSGAACIEGQSWGYDRNTGLWVTNGCRGRFAAR